MPQKYFLYARKSTEDEGKQVQSVDDQVRVMKEYAARNQIPDDDITVVWENKSAKRCKKREKFTAMLETIEQDKSVTYSLLVWAADRLARNMTDGGRIIDLLEEGRIKEIRAHHRTYTTNDTLQLTLDFGMSKEETIKISRNVTRGMQSKVDKGHLPERAPVGYLNDTSKRKGERDIIPDPQRFEIIKRCWWLLLHRQYSLHQIHTEATYTMDLRNQHGEKYARSYFYKMFLNPFYYGVLQYKGKMYPGAHQPMITKAEFDMAQLIVRNKQKPRPSKHKFSYVGLMRCGKCGSAITAYRKQKHQQNGKTHTWIYYTCAKSMDRRCRQSLIREDRLEALFISLLSEIEIPDEFRNWALDILRRDSEQESHFIQEMVEARQKSYQNCLIKIRRLLDMRLEGEIDVDTYTAKMAELNSDKERLSAMLRESDHQFKDWMKEAERLFDIAVIAKKRFILGDVEAKREALLNVCSNLVLDDGKLHLTTVPALQAIKNAAPGIQALHRKLEPRKVLATSGGYARLYEGKKDWCAIKDSNL